jgi:hypothetical protein
LKGKEDLIMTKSLEIVNAHIEMFKDCQKAYTKASDIETANEYKEDIKKFEIIKQDLERLENLEKENQELRDKLNSQDLDIWQLHCKYGDYKKAIDVLKDNCKFKFHDKSTYWKNPTIYLYSEFIVIPKEEDYELLKEVIKNEN